MEIVQFLLFGPFNPALILSKYSLWLEDYGSGEISAG